MDDLLKQIIPIFCQEGAGQCDAIAGALLKIEADPSSTPHQIEELFRSAHSLKGSASSLGLLDLEQIAHKLEAALLDIRRQRAALTHDTVDVCLKAVEAVRLRLSGLSKDNEEGKAEVSNADLLLNSLMSAADISGAGASMPDQRIDSVSESNKEIGENRDDGALHIPIARFGLLERRLEGVRSLGGRLGMRLNEMSALNQSVETLWREARVVSRDGGRQELMRTNSQALYQILQQIGSLRNKLLDDTEIAQTTALELDENLREFRTVPASILTQPLQLAAREASRRTGKEVVLKFVGSDVQTDRRVLEAMRSPLTHLLRNAIDHGVEDGAVREAIGKPHRGTIAFSVEQRGNDVRFCISDDGRGIDVEAVRTRAIALGRISEGDHLTAQQIYSLLFEAGFSTAEQVTELSGRGVGLDVVREVVARLHGRVDVTSTLGQGTTFAISVPLTVAAFETLLINECDRLFALPLSSVERIVRGQKSDLRFLGSRLALAVEEEFIPAVSLSQLLELTQRHHGSEYCNAVILQYGSQRVALICEHLVGQAELVLRPLPVELRSHQLLDAVAIRPNGQAIFLLSARQLVQAAASLPGKPVKAAGEPTVILVADDSAMTRSLLRSVLESSGYLVRSASNGSEALQLALAEAFDLIISDVRMPGLDGFGLATRLKADPRTLRVPIVLFSALDREDDRRLGVDSGADAYLTKQAFDKGHLLDVIERLLKRN